MNRGAKVLGLLALALASLHMIVLAWLFARRIGFPYDLEWMEGGMLCHSLRLLADQPIYAAPTVDFIPFLYTPLYPTILAWLSHIAPGGLTYTLGRFVSIASFAGALILAWRFVFRHGGSSIVACVAMAIPPAAFALTGSWYDIARPDSLWLLFSIAGLLLLFDAARDSDGRRRGGRTSHMGVALSALLLIAAFFTKQTASPLLLAGGLALLLLDWRLVPTYTCTLAFLGLPALYLVNRDSDGWFWTYIFQLHQAHEFYARRAYIETPWVLARILGPALALIPWALIRRSSPALLYSTWLALVGVLVSCVSFGTQWAYVNAYIPGVFLPAMAIGVAAGRLACPPATTTNRTWSRPLPRLRPAVVYLLLIVSLALHPFDPRPFIPSADDRAAGDRVIDRLRQAPGEVLIPFHPFYAHLAGKRTYLHRMGVLDVSRSSLGAPRGLAESLAEKRFALAIFDDKVAGNWSMFPGLLEHYRIVERLEPSPSGRLPFARPPIGTTLTGAPTRPLYVLTPKSKGQDLDHELH